MDFQEWYQMLRLLRGQELLDVKREVSSDGRELILLHFPSVVISFFKKDFETLYISPTVPLERIDELDAKENK